MVDVSVRARRPYIWDPWKMAEVQASGMAVAGNGTATWSELTHRADLLGAGLTEMGVRDGSVISTTVAPGPDFFALTLACLRYGFGLFPCTEALSNDACGAALREGTDVFLHIKSAGQRSPLGTPVVCYDDVLAAGASHPSRSPADREGFLIFATSGTTGDPVAVKCDRPRYPYRGVAVVDRYGMGPEPGAHIMANPTFHHGTVGPALYALQAGNTVVVPQEWSVESLGELVDAYRADNAFLSAFLSPEQLLDVAAYGKWPWRRPSLVIHGGSPCAISIKRAVIDLLGPTVHEIYGTTAGLITEISAEQWLEHPGSVGRPVPGVQVSIQRDGVPVEDGETAEICVMPRFVDRSGDGRGATSGLLRTGDLGYIDGDGFLYVVGRITGERPHDVAHLESTIRSLREVGDAVVLPRESGPDVTTVDCLVEILSGEPASLGRVIRQRADEMRLRVGTLDIRPIGGHARTRSGKMVRNHAVEVARQDGRKV